MHFGDAESVPFASQVTVIEISMASFTKYDSSQINRTEELARILFWSSSEIPLQNPFSICVRLHLFSAKYNRHGKRQLHGFRVLTLEKKIKKKQKLPVLNVVYFQHSEKKKKKAH